MEVCRRWQPLFPQSQTYKQVGGTWLTSSQSTRHVPGSLLDRYSAAVERWAALTTTDRSSTPIPSCNGSAGPGGNVSSLYDAIERAIGYGIQAPKPEDSADRPPLVTYETTPGPYGDVVRATNAYVAWFRRAYCVEGGEDSLSQSGINSPTKEVGGGDSGALAAGGRFKQNDLAP